MPLYKYQAKRGPKEVVCGTLEAGSPDELVSSLTQQGLFPIQVVPVIGQKELSTSIGVFSGSVRVRDLNLFTHQLASLLKSGVPLLKALGVIEEQTESQTLKSIVAEIGREVKDGRMFSEALKRYPNIFPPLYINLIRSGEESGTLDNVLVRLADYREKLEEIKTRVRSALVYPVLILVVGVLTIIFMMTFVVPQLKSVFDTFQGTLPLSTQILFSISDFMKDYWYIIFGGLFLVLLLGRGLVLVERMVWDDTKLHLPLIGNFIQKSELGKFCRTLSLLLTNGIPILSALEIIIPTVDNLALGRQLKKVTEGLRGGNQFAVGLKSSGRKYFPPFMSNLIAVGEESGRLDETLAEIANSYERETDEMIKIGLSLVEPALILIMGAVVGFVVISMLLPIFTMGTMVQ